MMLLCVKVVPQITCIMKLPKPSPSILQAINNWRWERGYRIVPSASGGQLECERQGQEPIKSQSIKFELLGLDKHFFFCFFVCLFVFFFAMFYVMLRV